MPQAKGRRRHVHGSGTLSGKGAMQILLAGPRVAHLAPFFEKRGYETQAHESGSDAMQAIRERLRDLIILELNLSDYSAPDFLTQAKEIQPEARYLLLDDTSRAGQVVKALVAGADGYVATPPDEGRLFAEVDRLLATSAKSMQERSAQTAHLQEQLEAVRGEAASAQM